MRRLMMVVMCGLVFYVTQVLELNKDCDGRVCNVVTQKIQYERS